MCMMMLEGQCERTGTNLSRVEANHQSRREICPSLGRDDRRDSITSTLTGRFRPPYIAARVSCVSTNHVCRPRMSVAYVLGAYSCALADRPAFRAYEEDILIATALVTDISRALCLTHQHVKTYSAFSLPLYGCTQAQEFRIGTSPCSRQLDHPTLTV